MGKINNCIFFLNCCCQYWYELRFPNRFSFIHTLSLTFYEILDRLKMKNSCDCNSAIIHSLILAKFCNTLIIIVLYCTCSIVFTTLSNQLLSLCCCNHCNWSVVARLVCFNLTSQSWLRFSDVFFLYRFL